MTSSRAASSPSQTRRRVIYVDQSAITKSQKVKNKKDRKPKSRLKRMMLTVTLLLVFAGVGVLGYGAYKVAGTTSHIFYGNFLDMLTGKQKLKTDVNGRSNALIFGTSEDDPGHSGAELADSIMVLSINPETEQANVISIPRDLWVSYDEPCTVGYQAKINTAYMCGMQKYSNDSDKASKYFANQVGKVLGIDIQYYAKVNFTVVEDLVDALGGIEVVIDSKDPRGILDRAMDNKCPNGPYTCYMVKYPNGPAKLDGAHALALSRARNAKGGYGLSRSNFDREQNQQKIMRAIQAKALSTGTLTNPQKIMDILDALGNNVKTNVSFAEIGSLADLGQKISPSDIETIDLSTSEDPLVTIGRVGAQSVVIPSAGVLDFSEIQKKIRQEFKPPMPLNESSNGQGRPADSSS